MEYQTTFSKADPERIYNPIGQVRLSNTNEDMEKLELSISKGGLILPIAVCKTENTEKSDEYDWHLVDGQRRLNACNNLDLNEVSIVIINEKEIVNEKHIPSIALNLNITQLPMETQDIWNTIQKAYFLNQNDVKKTAKATGIAVQLVKEAVAEHRIDDIRGAKKLQDYVIASGQLKKEPVLILDKIIDITLKENNAIDLPKAKKLYDSLLKFDYPVQKNILEVALSDPKGEIKTWVKDGSLKAVMQPLSVPFEKADREALREYIQKSGGGNEADFIYDLVMREITEE